jgi:hypothetical protein
MGARREGKKKIAARGRVGWDRWRVELLSKRTHKVELPGKHAGNPVNLNCLMY